MNKQRLIDKLVRHEGIRLKAYLDCCGKYWRECTCFKKGFITIGIGRNLDGKGITKEEAYVLLDNDLYSCIDDLNLNVSWWESLDDSRQEVLIEMCFQLGIYGLLGFKEFLSQLRKGDYKRASEEMINSKWAKQTAGRAKELSDIIKGI